ncbi:hypothetical protein QVD17_31793 [Tagetes erecta]|uniref:Beta-glucosidase n=1 Tax=Tagetes erecta TaxID=13708 RepID=A0AAD8KAL8_TARER|nr:hypothetical protein QVD17_31793 [Tagetes erecta]
MLFRMQTVVLLALGIVHLLLNGCFADEINKKSFPNDFVFGTGSSAYQYEGAVKEDGRGPCIWDKIAKNFGNVSDSSNADVTVDQYHLYEDDIKLMKDMGMNAYRFSISWSRIFPNGSGHINQAGIDHYNALINSLLAHNIEPYVTLFHWDHPQALEDKYKGWVNTQIIKDYVKYAKTCFKYFGDRVKNWMTFNEPYVFSVKVYGDALQALGHHSTERYVVAHNLLLSHASAYHVYKRKYKAKQNGRIGIAFDLMWYIPGTNKTEDIEATQRAQDYQLGWFLDPIMFGDYPTSMKTIIGDRLPRFSKRQIHLLKGSLDFVGVNHYTTWYALHNSTSIIGTFVNDSNADSRSILLPFKDGKAIGDRARSEWLYIVPWGIRSALNYVKNRYGNPPVIITENGMDYPNIPSLPIEEALKDDKRIKYHNAYLTNVLAAIKYDGCNVKGYFAWSLLDNWEWLTGFGSRFGLYYVDFNDNLKRHAKDSAIWFKNFLNVG